MNFWWLQSATTWTGSGSSPIGNELLGPSVPHRALRPQLARRRGTFQRGTVSNRIRELVRHSSMKSLLQRRIEASQDRPPIEADHHPGIGMTRRRRNNRASFAREVLGIWLIDFNVILSSKSMPRTKTWCRKHWTSLKCLPAASACHQPDEVPDLRGKARDGHQVGLCPICHSRKRRASRFALGGLREPLRCIFRHRAVCRLRRQVHQAEGTTASPGLRMERSMMQTPPTALPRTLLSSASSNGQSLHQSRPIMRARLLERTRRFAYLMLRHQCHFLNMPVHTMNSSSPTWGSLLEVVLMAKIKEAKASRRAKVRGKARRKGRASKAKVHREVPITIDYVGQSGWSQDYQFTWYWKQQRGCFWRWDWVRRFPSVAYWSHFLLLARRHAWLSSFGQALCPDWTIQIDDCKNGIRLE